MNYITQLDNKKYLLTFKPNLRERYLKYLEVKKLLKRGLTNQDIYNKLKISKDSVYYWKYNLYLPLVYKTMNIAEKRKYFQGHFLMREAKNLAYLVGYNMGDGNLSINLCNVWFYGHSNDLPKIKELLLKFKIKPKIYIYKIHNGKMAVHDTTFAHFMAALECPIGDKTKNSFGVPKWIINSNKEIKQNFLRGLCDSELSKVSKVKNRKFSYGSLKFYMSKEKHFIRDGILYLEQLRKLFFEFDIATSKIMKNRDYKRSRDKSHMRQLFFTVYSNYVNLNKFIENIGFLYNLERTNSINKNKKEIKKLSDFEELKLIKYREAIKLRKKGLSAYKIAKKLDIQIYYIKNWIYYKHKPKLLGTKVKTIYSNNS